MRVALESFCACVLLLFVPATIVTAQSIAAAPHSAISTVQFAPTPAAAPLPIVFECEPSCLRPETRTGLGFTPLSLVGSESMFHQEYSANSPRRKQEARVSLDLLPIAEPDAVTTLTDQEPNPLPEHTGLKTLVKDTASDFVAFPKRKSTWVFIAGGLGAALLAHQADAYVAEHVVGSAGADKFFKVGKVVGSAGFQVGTAMSLWLVGRYAVPRKPDGSRSNRLSHLGLDLLRAQIVSQAMVQATKHAVQRDRPTGECCAFPSGHATAAFASAAVFERHFGERGSWWALTAASYVAASRLVDNRHFLSDVVFGAALGEAIGWTVVGRHGRERYVLRAVPLNGGGMIVVANN